jgi:hypothetical protein
MAQTKFAVGKVKRMVASSSGLQIALYGEENVEGVNIQPDNYFLVEFGENYNSAYSLVLAAAINRYRLGVRTKDFFDPHTSLPPVSYVDIQW